MTKLEQETERALTIATAEWLRARGWHDSPAGGRIETLTGRRWTHDSAPQGAQPVNMADAVTLTRAEPLRLRRRA